MGVSRHLSTNVREDSTQSGLCSGIGGLLDFRMSLFSLEAGLAGLAGSVPPLDLHAFDEAVPDHSDDRVICEMAESTVPGGKVGHGGCTRQGRVGWSAAFAGKLVDGGYAGSRGVDDVGGDGEKVALHSSFTNEGARGGEDAEGFFGEFDFGAVDVPGSPRCGNTIPKTPRTLCKSVGGGKFRRWSRRPPIGTQLGTGARLGLIHVGFVTPRPYLCYTHLIPDIIFSLCVPPARFPLHTGLSRT